MTKEEFLSLNEKDQRSLVNITLHEKGWRIVPYGWDYDFGEEYHDKLMRVDKGDCVVPETPLSLVCGLGWPYENTGERIYGHERY
ncbi:hypothetical protein DA215_21165 [Salmonella enterica]|nr:hypothetical protein [Salmonella enterica]EDZ2385427.1 hypothetical protein [Salmonella enterica]EEE8719475.1 hypothetical protein [Salmonella enterica]EGV2705611.1 hypothetical protein [Salmonella enterica]EHO5591443.1 hypothetical protein [Salmonella enterica]